MIMNHPKAMAECIYPSNGFLCHIFRWKRQSPNRSFRFFTIVFGMNRDFQKRILSFLGIAASNLTHPTPIQHRKNVMPIVNGITKWLYPDGILSITSGTSA